MTTNELHEILDDDNICVQTYYAGEKNAFQIALDLLEHLRGEEE